MQGGQEKGARKWWEDVKGSELIGNLTEDVGMWGFSYSENCFMDKCKS